MVEGSNQPVPIAEPLGQPCGVVAGDWQSAAGRRTVQREGSDNTMTAGDQGTIHDPQISLLIGGVGQEVEGGAVVPDVEATGGLRVQHVGHHPFDRHVLGKSRPSLR